MPKSIQDLEREVLNLEQKKINIQIQIWNAKDNLLKAQASQDRKSDNDIDPIVSGSSSQGQNQTASTAQSDVRLTQASSQGQENNNSRSADSHSTPQQRNVSPLDPVEPVSEDSNKVLVNNRGIPTNSFQPGQSLSNLNDPKPSTSSARKDVAFPVEPIPLTALQMAQLQRARQTQTELQLKAQYARIGMVPPPSRPSTALDTSRSRPMLLSPIHSPIRPQEEALSSQKATSSQQRQITGLTSGKGSTFNDPFIQYGQLHEEASDSHPSNVPPTQDAGHFANTTSAGVHKTLLQSGHNTTQDSPTHSHNELHHSHGPLDQQAQQTPVTNTFSFYTGLQDIPPNSALQQDYASSEVDRPSSAGKTAPRLGKGLTKRSKDTTSPSLISRRTNSAPRTDNILQHKRAPSVEVTDQRPRQRLRSEDSRVKTPPLNEKDNIQSEHEVDSFNGFRPAEQGRKITFGVIDEFNAAPPLRRAQRPDVGSSNSNPAHRPPQQSQPPAPQTSPRQAPPTPAKSAANLKSVGRQINENYSEDDEETPQDQQQRHRRQVTGTPALLAEATKNIRETDQVAPRPARPRKPQGSYKTAEYKPLSPAERHDLEKRFCCQVAKIIGSKICVNKPPMPFDNVRIFDRLRERLLGKNFSGDGEGGDSNNNNSNKEKYRTATDFQNDARRMLQDYVKLGQCEGCPFEATGNARVMCYRMRLTSILDARMREIKQCIYECEIDFDASDWEGRRHRIDTWFGEADFQEAGHDSTR